MSYCGKEKFLNRLPAKSFLFLSFGLKKNHLILLKYCKYLHLNFCFGGYVLYQCPKQYGGLWTTHL